MQVFPVVHDDQELEVGILLAKVDQGGRFSCSRKSNNFDDVTNFWIQVVSNYSVNAKLD